MNTKAALGLAVGALAVGLLAGMALGGDKGDEPAKVEGPGPTRTVSGVPVGYAHTQAGAVAAATAYTGVVGPLALAAPDARRSAVQAMSDPKTSDVIQQDLEPGLQALAKGLTTPSAENAVIRAAPVGYRVQSYTDTTAVIDVWAVGIVGNGESLPPAASWGVSKVSLRWVSGDWKLASSLEQSQGPTPQLSGSASSSPEFAPATRDFKGFNHAPTD